VVAILRFPVPDDDDSDDESVSSDATSTVSSDSDESLSSEAISNEAVADPAIDSTSRSTAFRLVQLVSLMEPSSYFAEEKVEDDEKMTMEAIFPIEDEDEDTETQFWSQGGTCLLTVRPSPATQLCLRVTLAADYPLCAPHIEVVDLGTGGIDQIEADTIAKKVHERCTSELIGELMLYEIALQAQDHVRALDSLRNNCI
jgi:hypothetical protein